MWEEQSKLSPHDIVFNVHVSHSKFKSLVRARATQFYERRHKFECRYVRPCISPTLSLDQPMLTGANIVPLTIHFLMGSAPYLALGEPRPAEIQWRRRHAGFGVGFSDRQ